MQEEKQRNLLGQKGIQKQVYSFLIQNKKIKKLYLGEEDRSNDSKIKGKKQKNTPNSAKEEYDRIQKAIMLLNSKNHHELKKIKLLPQIGMGLISKIQQINTNMQPYYARIQKMHFKLEYQLDLIKDRLWENGSETKNKEQIRNNTNDDNIEEGYLQEHLLSELLISKPSEEQIQGQNEEISGETQYKKQYLGHLENGSKQTILLSKPIRGYYSQHTQQQASQFNEKQFIADDLQSNSQQPYESEPRQTTEADNQQFFHMNPITLSDNFYIHNDRKDAGQVKSKVNKETSGNEGLNQSQSNHPGQYTLNSKPNLKLSQDLQLMMNDLKAKIFKKDPADPSSSFNCIFGRIQTQKDQVLSFKDKSILAYERPKKYEQVQSKHSKFEQLHLFDNIIESQLLNQQEQPINSLISSHVQDDLLKKCSSSPNLMNSNRYSSILMTNKYFIPQLNQKVNLHLTSKPKISQRMQNLFEGDRSSQRDFLKDSFKLENCLNSLTNKRSKTIDLESIENKVQAKFNKELSTRQKQQLSPEHFLNKIQQSNRFSYMYNGLTSGRGKQNCLETLRKQKIKFEKLKTNFSSQFINKKEIKEIK